MTRALYPQNKEPEMKVCEVRRVALSGFMAVALLAGCGGSQALPVVTKTGDSFDGAALPYHKTFRYTGSRQSFIVPAGVTQLTVVARGGSGGRPTYYTTRSGRGGRV